MEFYTEAYKNRCIKRLKEWNAPVSDWNCVDMYDVLDGDENSSDLFTCKLCGCSQVRYVHVMRHDEYFEDVHVGCICAGIMDGDILAAKERDREMKNRAKRKRNYLRREWKVSVNGDKTLRYKNGQIAIIESGFGDTGLGVVYNGKSVWQYKNRKITDFLSAVHAAFDLVDPPVKAVQS